MEKTHPPLVRTRLSMMMFLEFFIWGGWGFALGGYADNLGFKGWMLGLVIAIPAVGAMVSPLLVGVIADRFFPAQRMLSGLHILGGISLLLAGALPELVESESIFWPLMILMMLNGLFFMPTIALCNSVAFRHIPDPDKFPRIAVLGTAGWIVAVLAADVFLGGMKAPNFLYQSGVASIVLAFYALTLPHTPPKGTEADAKTGADPFGMSALKLLKEPSFLVFLVCVSAITIPACGYFFALAGAMFQQRGYPAPLALTTLCQFAELIFMFSMPWFVSRLGLKRVLLIGMAAWAVRYLCFMCPHFEMAVVGLLLHGFCYSFLYVGSYMYVDKRAPEDLKASAQSLLAFLFLGVAWFVGAQGAGLVKGAYPPEIGKMTAVSVETGEVKEDAGVPRWDDPDAATSLWRFVNLSDAVRELLGEEKKEAKPDLAKQLGTDKDDRITLAAIEQFKDSEVSVDGMKYSKDDLIDTFKEIHQKLGLEGEVALDRGQWLKAHADDWAFIWLWPSILCFAVLAYFAVAFRDKPQEE